MVLNHRFHYIFSGELNTLRAYGLKSIAMTTNGVTLKRKVPALKEAGLDQINVSLDTLIPAKFELITRRKGWHKVMEGLDEALLHDLDPVKVNINQYISEIVLFIVYLTFNLHIHAIHKLNN